MYKKSSRWYCVVSTLGSVGYLPASGTVASFLAFCSSVLLIPLLGSCFFMVWVLLLVSAYYCIAYALPWFGGLDPSQIVLDEFVAACLVCFCVPQTAVVLSIAFLLFRLFDIYKYGVVGWAEQLPGAWGVLADDLCAALLSATGVGFLAWLHVV